MVTTDPFDLLGDNDNDDPSQLLAAQEQKVVRKATITPAQSNAQQEQKVVQEKTITPARSNAQQKKKGFWKKTITRAQSNAQQKPAAAKLPGNPLPDQAGGFGMAAYLSASSGYSGGYGAYESLGMFQMCWKESDWETEEATIERSTSPEKQLGDEDVTVGIKENTAIEAEEKELEDKEMPLEENQKVLEKKRKASQALKKEERQVALDKELESMQQLANKKGKSAIE